MAGGATTTRGGHTGRTGTRRARRPAAQQTAYELGRTSEDPPPANIANDADLLNAWDEGRTAQEDAAAGGSGVLATSRPASTGDTSPASADTSSRGRGLLRSAGSAARPVADEIGGLFLGAIVYALGLNYLRGGWSGATRVDSDGVTRTYGVGPWLAAKFVNTTPADAATPVPAPSTEPRAVA